MVQPWAAVIESHYLETVEGLFFAVKGAVHPPDRFLVCLRYVPDPAGSREVAGVRYRRLYHFGEQEDLLRERYPHYLAFDETCGLTLQSVPRTRVRRIFDPVARLQQLRAEDGRDAAAGAAVAFANTLARTAQVSPAAFGVSGSLLIGLHTPASDLDLTVYGAAAGRAVQAAVHRLFDGKMGGVSPLDGEGMQTLYAERTADTHMSLADFLRAERRKVNQGLFQGRPYFVRFVLPPAEIDEGYGDYRYKAEGRATIVAMVGDASRNLFTPCCYKLEDVQFV